MEKRPQVYTPTASAEFWGLKPGESMNLYASASGDNVAFFPTSIVESDKPARRVRITRKVKG